VCSNENKILRSRLCLVLLFTSFAAKYGTPDSCAFCVSRKRHISLGGGCFCDDSIALDETLRNITSQATSDEIESDHQNPDFGGAGLSCFTLYSGLVVEARGGGGPGGVRGVLSNGEGLATFVKRLVRGRGGGRCFVLRSDERVGRYDSFPPSQKFNSRTCDTLPAWKFFRRRRSCTPQASKSQLLNPRMLN
jgi:hypothetical protein